ncbi:MAG: DEAD/DEAH box helicase [bacterium]|nr:DEAD/DEAH box helicase [bacterium]
MFRNRNRASFGRHQGGFARRKFNKSANGGSYSYPKSISAGRRISQATKSELGDDINVFIKKAAETASGESFTPHNNFADFDIAAILKQNISAKGYTHPTPIQDKAIRPLLEGRDLIGIANTGTGKTAAFLIPLINKIYTDPSQRMLILTPTRELAGQINEELHILSRGMNMYSSLAIGGANIHRQISDLHRRPSVVIGTPGRIRDLIERRVLHLADFRTFVLDEVDRMVDIGFIREVQYFVSLLPADRQSLFFSATIPPKAREVLQAFVTDPVTVSVKEQNIPENIDQDVVKVNGGNKLDKLHDLLNRDEFEKVLIFGRTKHGIDRLDRQLTEKGFKVASLHGNRRQSQRQKILRQFKEDQIKILLATDVASRGLDIDNVSHVINYDLPETYDDYVHRIGRTGRANKRGAALTFVD